MLIPQIKVLLRPHMDAVATGGKDSLDSKRLRNPVRTGFPFLSLKSWQLFLLLATLIP